MKEIKVFRDPLYGYVKVYESLIWELIQTKEFQRLRRIHQLGGTYMVYHTAEHTRFSHSLGVYEVARRIIYEVEDIRTILTKEERLMTLCAALLHDLGHGPFSHAFEHIFDTHHEAWTRQVILDQSTEVHQVLENYENGLSIKIARLIEKRCYEDNCLDECNHEIMISIISSQLDADRLDYLQRDAYYSGATYGEIDLERIIRSFLVDKRKIAFKYSSMHAIENYLMSRYHMYWQVYFHPVGVSYEILLINLFKRVQYLISKQFNFKTNMSLLIDFMNKDITTENYLECDEVWVLYKIKEFRHEEDEILVDLSNRILNRHLYKYINCKDQKSLDHKLNQITDIFKQYKINTEYYLYTDTLFKDAYEYYHDHVSYNSPILLKVDGELIEITELSHVVKGIKNMGVKTDYKLYYAYEVIQQFSIKDQARFEQIINS
jgi:uncharacterized protein